MDRKLPFFFVSTDFFAGTLTGFFTALGVILATLMRGSLSEFSSVSKPVGYIQKHF